MFEWKSILDKLGGYVGEALRVEVDRSTMPFLQ